MRKTLAITALGSLLIWNAAAQNLVVNGGFENPTTAYFTSFAPGSIALTGWTIDATPPDGVQLATNSVFANNNGSQNLQLTGGASYDKGGGISQTIATTPDTYYTVSIDIASRGSTATATGNFNFGGNNRALSVFGRTFTNVTWQVVATGSSTPIDITGDPNSGSKQFVIDNVSVVQTVPGPVDPGTSTVGALPSSVAADGLSTSTITVRLTDTNGVPASGKTVTLAHTSGPGTPVITTVSGTTSSSGRATFTVASTTAGADVFTATDVTDSLTITQTATVNFLAGSVANVGTSTVVAAPTSVVADGSTTSTITVTLKNAVNNPVSGKTVTLAKTSGPGTPVITTVSGISDVNGRATFTVASTTAGTDVLTATDVTDGNIAITQTATVTFTVGPVSLATSTVVASPAYVPADNSSASTITVTLRDATSNGVPNKTVSLSQTSGPGSPSITPVSGTTTDGNGAVAFAVSSSTPGVDVLAATDVDDSSLVLTNTATVTFLGLISWSGLATTVSDDSDVVTNGILAYAEHWAGLDGAVNGVYFTAAQNNVVGSSGGYETLNETNGYPQGSLSTIYWNILRGKWYNAGSGQTVTLNSLQAGHKYLLQIWSSDPRYSSTQEEIILPGFALGIKAGQYGVGTFTANGSIHVLALAGDGVLNAVQVRDLSTIAINAGPGAGQMTIRGYTESAGGVVTERTTSLATPIVWTPIQTNALSGGNFSFVVPTAGAAAYYRTKQ